MERDSEMVTALRWQKLLELNQVTGFGGPRYGTQWHRRRRFRRQASAWTSRPSCGATRQDHPAHPLLVARGQPGVAARHRRPPLPAWRVLARGGVHPADVGAARHGGNAAMPPPTASAGRGPLRRGRPARAPDAAASARRFGRAPRKTTIGCRVPRQKVTSGVSALHRRARGELLPPDSVAAHPRRHCPSLRRPFGCPIDPRPCIRSSAHCPSYHFPSDQTIRPSPQRSPQRKLPSYRPPSGHARIPWPCMQPSSHSPL